MEEEMSISVWNGISNYLKCLTGDIQLIILGEKHKDEIEWKCQEELIKKITPDYGLILHMGVAQAPLCNYSFKELMGSLSRIERVVNYVVERTKTQSREAGYGTPAFCIRLHNAASAIPICRQK